MSKFDKYMQDRSIEQSLSEERKQETIKTFKFGQACNYLENTQVTDEEYEFWLYCVLNNKTDDDFMMNTILKERGLKPIDFEKAKKIQEESKGKYQGTIQL